MSESTGLIPPRTYHNVAVGAAPDVMGAAVPKSAEQLAEALKAKFGESSVIEVQEAGTGDAFVVVDPSQIVEILTFLRDDEKFYCTILQVISAVDYLPKDEDEASERKTFDAVELMYAVQSLVHKHELRLKVRLDRNAPKVASVTKVYRCANWYERECYDMIGVHFEGHPHHKRILLPPDWVGHPLRKDYEFPEEYNGMKVPL
jgi:NADH-quinone oxidoreductase subunit C